MSENLSSIERVAELIYDKKNVSKQKHDAASESEESDEEKKNATTEKKKKSPQKLPKYQKFVQEEHPKLKDEYSNKDIFKVIGGAVLIILKMYKYHCCFFCFKINGCKVLRKI
ncbi:hypothetical protein F8M41_006154 [Gigaspora margarita]|uniref:Uncharacterized protein n=1 Tax=Gigaspora margarita TaxID=4874 RepID=A0A8H4AWY2_GIGMA|nr:hypothetical protein F8M41_006154 [Gigaspora margarita]